MSNFIYSLNGTVPIFAVIVLGYWLKRRNILTPAFVSAADKFVFQIALPLMVFKDLWQAKIREEFDLPFVGFCFGATVICFVVIWLGAELFMKDKTMIGAFVQGSFRSSAAVLGLAFISNMYGDVGLAPLMIVGAVPCYNVASVVVLTFRGRNQDKVKGFDGIKKACKGIITNPIIIAIVLGCAASLVQLKLPVMVTQTIDLIQRTATPLALLAIGAGFTFTSAKEKTKPAIWATLIKLVIQPFVFIPLAMLCGFKEQEMLAILIMLAGPATVSGYIMAKEMDNDDVLASCIIVYSTLFSAVTLTIWIYVLKSLGRL